MYCTFLFLINKYSIYHYYLFRQNVHCNVKVRQISVVFNEEVFHLRTRTSLHFKKKQNKDLTTCVYILSLRRVWFKSQRL